MHGVKISLADLLGGHSHSDTESEPNDGRPSISNDGQIANLREFLEQYSGSNPFNIGDIVVPRPTSRLKGQNQPHIVVDTKAPEYHFSGSDYGAHSFGERLSVRVARMVDGDICCWWMNHSQLMPFIEE